MEVLENTPAVLSLGKLCDENGYSNEWINGQKTTSHQKRYSDTVQHGELRSDRGSWFVNEFFIQFSSFNLNETFNTGESSSYIYLKRQERRDLFSSGTPEEQLLTKPSKNPKPNKNKTPIERGDPLSSDILEWLQEFMENLVDEEIPAHGDSHASSSHEASLEPIFKRSEDLGKHSVHTHFLKDRNCEICERTKITRAPCRRRNGGAVLRAENFGDLITADHKVLSEGCESRNSHRYAVVVQDLATQWIQSYPCKTKTSQDTLRSLQKFLEPNRKPKVIYTDNSLESGKACEGLSWNHCASTPHRSETSGDC